MARLQSAFASMLAEDASFFEPATAGSGEPCTFALKHPDAALSAKIRGQIGFGPGCLPNPQTPGLPRLPCPGTPSGMVPMLQQKAIVPVERRRQSPGGSSTTSSQLQTLMAALGPQLP